MKKQIRFFLFIGYLIGTVVTIYFLLFIIFQPSFYDLISDWTFWPAILFYFISIEEFLHWAKIGKRSEMSDIIAIAFFFFIIFFFTKDLLTSMMGAFSIYLWVGIAELKDYPVINKILIISLVTYNVIFIAGLISFYLEDPFILNTTFAFSFWIILGLGFLLFGRKYIVVWRFMSPAYLTLFLYILAWLAVAFVNQYTPINFIYESPLEANRLTFSLFIMNIYFVLIAVNWIVYFFTGPILDKMLGIKRVKNEKLLNIVEEVKGNLGIKDNVKVGFGKYPILNAMAYGSVFDKRIAIIAEDMDQIPDDELKGIVAHELSHTKGRHTLILTFITSIDLFIRMLLGFPATYYDYTFGDPEIPMVAFIFLNMAIYMVLYIFVRYLEGTADKMSKEAGYAKELAKALYNLESFYASGREIGLNTMLLCEEKITRENQLLDYLDTADYLYSSMIKPSRASLLSNLMNSHPPTYHRIAAILGDNLSPGKEALLPFICMKKSKQQKYGRKFKAAREDFKSIATQKFKEYFKVENIAALLEDIERKKLYTLDIGNTYIFSHKITEELVIGDLEDVQFLDNICETDQYIVKDRERGTIKELSASQYSKKQIQIEGLYLLDEELLRLKSIKLSEKQESGTYIFQDKENNEIRKAINKTKLPLSISNVKNFLNQDIFLKEKGQLKIFRCIEVKEAEKLEDFELVLKNSKQNDTFQLPLNQIIIRPYKIYFSIRKSKEDRQIEHKLFNWLVENSIRAYVYLKKPVNNLEIGYIQQINNNSGKTTNNMETTPASYKEYIRMINIFGEEKTIPYETLEIISFDFNSAIVQKKTETSFASKLGYKILKKFKPQKVMYFNKI